MANVAERIRFSEETIGHALHEGRLHVPRHQRSYAWEEDNVAELYHDLSGAIENQDEYFLGTIVVVSIPQANRYEVNDGQQRLATSAILIAAIRDYFARSKDPSDKETARMIEERFLSAKDIQTHESLDKLYLNAEDHEYFRKRVLVPPDDPERIGPNKTKSIKHSHKRISKAADFAEIFVRDLVKTLPEPEKGKRLHRWWRFLEEGARVIWVVVSDEATAYLIFETMNDRGLNLSAADLLKNHLLGQAGVDRIDEAFQKWNAMVAIIDTLGEQEDAVVNFIRYLWIAENGPTRSKELYKEIKDRIKNPTAAIKFATDLEVRAGEYAAILTSSHDRWSKYDASVRRNIEILALLGWKQMRPMLLAAVRKFQVKELPRLLQSCINWSVRLNFSGRTPGVVEAPIGRSAMKIGKGEITSTKQLLTELERVIPDDGQFKSGVAEANVAQSRLARYYLRFLQTHIDNVDYVPKDDDTITLEHILPEKPGTNWPNIDAETARSLYGRFGNQALLKGTINSDLGNAGYAIKKPVLAASPYSLTQDCAKFDEWNGEAIAKRQRHLADLAVAAWPLLLK